MKIKNFWKNSFLRILLWTSEIHPLRTSRNFSADYRKTFGSKSYKILAKKNKSSRKKTVVSNVSSLHVKSMLRRTIQVFWVESLVFLLSKSGSFWTQNKEKKNNFLTCLAWTRQKQIWQGCQIFTPKSGSFCSKAENNWKSFFCWKFYCKIISLGTKNAALTDLFKISSHSPDNFR